MRSFILLMSALVFANPAAAQERSNVVFGKSVDTVPMAEWEIVAQGRAEQTGARVLIAAGTAEVEKAPPSAARYDSRTYKFPTGQIRLLKFAKNKGGVIHQITFETELFVLKGSATVGMGGKDVEIGAGDAVSLPSGVLRSKANAAEDTEIIVFTVGHRGNAPKAALVRGKDTPAQELKGDPKASGAAKVSVQRYAFDGNSIRVAQLKGPGMTGEATPGGDVILYVTSGKMKITVGDETKEVSAGDAVREEAGKPTHWEVLEESSFVATDAPHITTPAKK